MAKDTLDLVVVGAGAAGIGAARAAIAAGRTVRVLEAADRVGGRALTTEVEGLPFDLGAHYLHHASRNPLAALALRQGVRMQLDLHAETTPEWLVIAEQTQAAAARDDCAAFYDACFEAIARGTADVAVSELVDTASPFYPLLRAWIAAHYGAPPEEMSALDVHRQQDVELDWPVRSGLGNLVHDMAEGLPVHLGTAVRAVRRVPGGVEVSTPEESLRARAALVTVSVEVLRRGAIRFEPGLPDDLQRALDGVRMGHAERLAFHARAPLVAPGTPRAAHVLSRSGRAVQVYLHEFDDPLVTVYLAGDLARDLGADGPEAMLAHAEEALVDLLGTDVRAQLGARVASGWSRDPRIGGGYSVARPGRADDRKVLARPFDARIRLAGEACSVAHFGTVHGAWSSGIEAVHDLLTEGALG